MAVEFLADVYGLTGMGKKIKIAHEIGRAHV